MLVNELLQHDDFLRIRFPLKLPKLAGKLLLVFRSLSFLRNVELQTSHEIVEHRRGPGLGRNRYSFGLFLWDQALILLELQIDADLFCLDLAKPDGFILQTEGQLAALKRYEELLQVVLKGDLHYVLRPEQPQDDLLVKVEFCDIDLSLRSERTSVLTDKLDNNLRTLAQILCHETV